MIHFSNVGTLLCTYKGNFVQTNENFVNKIFSVKYFHSLQGLTKFFSVELIPKYSAYIYIYTVHRENITIELGNNKLINI